MISYTDVCKGYNIHGGTRTVLDKVVLRLEGVVKFRSWDGAAPANQPSMRLISGAENPTSGIIRRRMSVSWPLALNGGFQEPPAGLDNLRFICRIYNTPFRP